MQIEQRLQEMIHKIETEVNLTAEMIGRYQLSDDVVSAIQQVPRHRFVDPVLIGEAYENHPLPIGYSQTISQPYMVAIMTELLEPRSHHKVLEVGCGSGYQAAILSLLVEQVVSLEIIRPLADEASDRLAELGYSNVEVVEADGNLGWPGQAPYDGIIVTACAEEIPQALIDQLARGGHLIIPVGGSDMQQYLFDVHKHQDGSVTSESIMAVRFVPLTGG